MRRSVHGSTGPREGASTPRRRRARRLATCLLAAVALIVGTAGAGAAQPVSPGPQPPSVPNHAKIKPQLQTRLAAHGSANFWVRFDQHADLSKASHIADWTARGEAVAAALQRTAKQSQQSVRAQLDKSGVKYQAFWATNAIYVPGGSQQLADRLSASPDVQSLYPTTKYALPKLTEGTRAAAVDGIEWGVADINADKVWSQYGDTGKGITVASIDTGVQFDHPALVQQYRGNNGDGTFEHNYNWFDASGKCDGAPCDGEGHGTHTMGTMVGDDGGNNHIGVAPGAKWIEANGCCDSDATLINSGQWMLLPTDLNGQNPDASKRPNIINNSWGSETPSNDPFMEDVTNAWAASGIFAVWSNGNNGSGCNTSGSPGSRIANYSVGAYDVNDQIASFSSRGVGQDGETKPNLSAPGVNIRSSFPGDSYRIADGTSMAAPHVAGTVALLWSAAPQLIGDIDGTRALLDGSSIDTPDDQCGGTADDNDVYGEGRLDALALLDAAPIQDNGSLSATVTDAGTGRPIGGAQIDVQGPVNVQRLTDADGNYRVSLPPGDYTVTAKRFGYADQAQSVRIVDGADSAVSFALQTQPTAVLSGVVSDDSGQGWPLYAAIAVAGMPDGPVYSDPVTGRYRIALPKNATYDLTITSRYGGYRQVTQQVKVGGTNVTDNVAVPVDGDDCTAAGYDWGYDGAGSTFDSGQPDGWTTDDNVGDGQVWRFDDPQSRGNRTGGDGGFAVLDGQFYRGGHQDTSLISPVADLTGQDSPNITFKQDFDPSRTNTADVDLSLDGGATWQTVLHQPSAARGPRSETIPIPQAANQANVRIRFHYTSVVDGWYSWWQVDDVIIGVRSCRPQHGGLVVGQVRDENTKGFLHRATVTSDDDPGLHVRSASTPDDQALGDGFYWLFSPLTGTHRFTAASSEYSSRRAAANVLSGGVTERNFQLAAGRLSVSTDDIRAKVPLGKSKQRAFKITNTGTATTTIKLSEGTDTFTLLNADGTTMTQPQVAASPGAKVVRVPGHYSSGPLAIGTRPAARNAPLGAQPNETPWTSLPDYPVPVMDNTVDVYHGKIYSVGGVVNDGGLFYSASGYVYDPAAQSWSPIADLPGVRENAEGAFLDGRFYVSGGYTGNGAQVAKSTDVYDPTTNTWSQAAPAPLVSAAAGQAVLDGKLYLVGGCNGPCSLPDVRRYDPSTDSWQTLADYPEPSAFLACGAIEGKIYCAGGTSRHGGTTHAYVYDPASDAWTSLPDMPIPLWGMAYTAANDQLVVSGGITASVLTNASFAYDPDAGTWLDLPAANEALYRGGSTCGLIRVGGSDQSGGFSPRADVGTLPGYGSCTSGDASWLSLNTTSATLDPGESVTVRVSLDADLLQPGTLASSVWIKEKTPYMLSPVDVTVTVRPPKTWGKVMGTITGRQCDGTSAPLAGATVEIDSWATELPLRTAHDGTFAYWIDRRGNPYTIIVAEDGWRPQTGTFKIKAGRTVTRDFTLRPITC